MGQVFNLSSSTFKELDRLYDDKVIDSKEVFVELAIAIGIATDSKEKVSNPKAFHTLSELDKAHVFTIIANTRNLELKTEEDVTRELEEYAQAGIRILIEKEIKNNKLNYYKLLNKYSD